MELTQAMNLKIPTTGETIKTENVEQKSAPDNGNIEKEYSTSILVF